MGLFKKIIAGGLGWTLGGPIGAIIGVALASLFDENKTSEYKRVEGEYTKFTILLSKPKK